MQKAIIHTATRVVRRLTTDDSPPVSSDESVVELAKPIDLAGGYWKLSVDNEKALATTQEAITAGVDESHIASQQTAKRQAYVDAVNDFVSSIDGVSTLSALRPKLKAFFIALKDLI